MSGAGSRTCSGASTGSGVRWSSIGRPSEASTRCRFAGAADVAVVDTPEGARPAIERGVPAVTTDPAVAIALDELDVLVEGTGSLDYGAGVIVAALEAGRAVVSINAEVDATIGWLLHSAAAAHGGVYTICDGDQPGVLMRTVDRVQHMGFEPSSPSTASATSTCTSPRSRARAYAARDCDQRRAHRRRLVTEPR